MHQISKRARAMLHGKQPYGQRLTGKTHSHQRKHREKLHHTRAGWEEHQKRKERRQTEKRRIHKVQNHAWNGA